MAQGNQFFTPTTPFQGPQSYDISGIGQGYQALQDTNYNPTQSRAYTFSTPGVSNVASRQIVGGPNVTGRMQGPGNYGTASGQEVTNAYSQGFGAAASPIRSQGQERMRQLGQGFQGGRMSGNANRAFAMQNAQKTGEDLRDVARTLGSNIQGEMFNQGNTARAADYGTNLGIAQDYQNQLRERDTGAYNERTAAAGEDSANRARARDMQFQGDLATQTNQATNDLAHAGLTEQQAQFGATNAMQKAMSMLGAGFAYPQLQSQLYGNMLQGWNAMQNMGGYSNGTSGA